MSSDQDVLGQDHASHPSGTLSRTADDLDVERDSDVPISTQIYWQIAYQIDSGRLLGGARLAPVRELGAALRPCGAAPIRSIRTPSGPCTSDWPMPAT